MNYNQTIIDALENLGVPVAFQAYTGTAQTYITFFCYNEQGEEWAEDAEIATGYYIQVNLWSKSDYTTLAGQVKDAMIAAGFARTGSQDLYEPETKIYHKALRFVCVAAN